MTDTVERTLRLSAAYGALSRILGTPDEGAHRLLDSGEARDRVAAALDDLDALSDEDEVSAAGFDGDTEELKRLHIKVFGLVPTDQAPPLETQWDNPHVFQQAGQLSDIAGFYEAFGLEPRRGLPERLDHAAVELEFISFLAGKEAYARALGTREQEEICRDARRAFLESHLLRWVPAFCRRLAAGPAAETAYEVVANWLDRLVRADGEARGIRIPEGEALEVEVTGFDEDEEPAACGGCPADPGLEIPK